MGKFFLLVGAAFALMLLAATAAFAGQGNGKPNTPGAQAAEAGHGNAYGRDKDTASGEAQNETGAEQEDEVQQEDEEDSGQAEDGTEAHGQAGEAHGKDGGGNNDAGAAATKGKSDEAKHHVIVCHRTGSDTNPYVVINVSVRAWEHGHTTHPELDGRSDILLKDPAAPGEKLDRGLCKEGSGGSGGGGNGGGSGGSGGSGGGGNGGSGGVGGHEGDEGGGGSPGSTRGGEPGPVATEDLPFTGTPAMIVLLVGFALAAAGLALRKKPAS